MHAWVRFECAVRCEVEVGAVEEIGQHVHGRARTTLNLGDETLLWFLELGFWHLALLCFAWFHLRLCGLKLKGWRNGRVLLF